MKFKGLRNKITAVCLTAVTCAAVCLSGAYVFADSESYQGGYSIKDVLSNYQVFVEGDMSIASHTVGAVACGGTGHMGGAFGDGAIVSSYIANLEATGNYAAGSYFKNKDSMKDYAGYGDQGYSKVYYTNGSASGDNFVKTSSPYVDFATGFSTIRSESKNIADNGYRVTEADIKAASPYSSCKILTLDFSKHNSYTIDADIYTKFTNINITGVDSVDDFETKECTISIVGVDEVNLSFGSAYITDPTSSKKSVMFKSDNEFGTFDNKLKDMSSIKNTTQDSQYNVTGMKLMTNIVDATSVEVGQLSGHIVAPNAALSMTGGNYEGCVIAKSLVSCSGEGHFYPYNRVKTMSEIGSTEVSTSESTTEITSENTTSEEATSEDSETTTEATTQDTTEEITTEVTTQDTTEVTTTENTTQDTTEVTTTENATQDTTEATTTESSTDESTTETEISTTESTTEVTTEVSTTETSTETITTETTSESTTTENTTETTTTEAATSESTTNEDSTEEITTREPATNNTTEYTTTQQPTTIDGTEASTSNISTTEKTSTEKTTTDGSTTETSTGKNKVDGTSKDDPSSTNTSDSSTGSSEITGTNVNTGDDFNIAIPICVIVFALIASSGIVIYKKTYKDRQ